MNKQGCSDAITRILKSNKARIALAAIILFSVTAICQAKEIDPADKEELKRRSQAEAWERQRKGQEKDVFLQQQSPAEKTTVLPPEEPSFLINDLVLEGDKVDHFPWAKNILKPYRGQVKNGSYDVFAGRPATKPKILPLAYPYLSNVITKNER